MLILTRRIREQIEVRVPPCKEETVVIVTMLGWKGSQGKLGVEAPNDVSIDRYEVARRKENERDDNGVDSHNNR